MRKSDVHAHFKTLAAIAKAVGISKSGVGMWPDIVPQGHAFRLHFLTNGRLEYDPALYEKPGDLEMLRAASAERTRIARLARRSARVKPKGKSKARAVLAQSRSAAK